MLSIQKRELGLQFPLQAKVLSPIQYIGLKAHLPQTDLGTALHIEKKARGSIFPIGQCTVPVQYTGLKTYFPTTDLGTALNTEKKARGSISSRGQGTIPTQ